MNKNAKIYVAGHRGMVGSAIARELNRQGYETIIGKTHAELDLTNQTDVDKFFSEEKPEYVFVGAAMVGGIIANMKNHAGFLMKNMQIECNVINAAAEHGVKKLLFLGSSCIYPAKARQPLKEEYLLTGSLEPTNEGYAIAKIAGLKMCEYLYKEQGKQFISVMPCNLYGYNDNFHPEHSHMLPALIRRFHEAKISGAETVTVWGTGNVYRELLFVEDLAKACVFVMNNYSCAEFLNAGYGEDFTIAQIAESVREAVGYKGNIVFDPSKPDGMFRKVMDSGKINALGWKAETHLDDGIKLTYGWYLNHCAQARGHGVK
ncbi:GDP-L-fucose synthase [Clostridia bacterium]|nr:GDP-L-fucose synthase [Clostridia bacterium]